MAIRKERLVQTQVGLTSAQLDALYEIAESSGTPVSAVIRSAVEAFLAARPSHATLNAAAHDRQLSIEHAASPKKSRGRR